MAQQFRSNCLFAALFLGLFAISPARALAQVETRSDKKANIGPPPGASIARGQIVYKDRCAICHFSESDARKIGPGLKGLYRRGKFSDGGKVDDAAMEDRILNGGKDMPPFRSALNSNQVRDLIAYLRTLH